jgi:hypothetical protein
MITVQRATPRMSLAAANENRVSDPSLRPTLPMPRQQFGVRRGFTASAVGLGLLVGSAFFWSLRHADLQPRALDATDSSPGTASVPAASTESFAAGAPTHGPISPNFHNPSKADSAILLAKHDTAGKDSVDKKPALDTVPTHAPIQQLASTIAQADSAKLVRAYPYIPTEQRDFLIRVFAQDSTPHVTPVYITSSSPRGDRAEIAFDLRLEFYDKGKQKRSTPLKFTATLERHGDRWAISDLKRRI